MFEIGCIVALAIGLVGLTVVIVARDERAALLQLVMVGYGLRLLLFTFVMRSFAFFSHGIVGGDCLLYERLGSLIALRWRFGHVHFVTASEMPALGSVALPCNVFASLEYLAHEPVPLADTAVVAFVACWMVLVLYRFLRDGDVEKRVALTFAAIVLFGPAFLYHTSDTYKDGINAFLVIASLLGAIRLSQRFEPWRLLALLLSLSALWYVRHYMVFMCLTPLVFGVLGTGRASVGRRLLAGAFLALLAAGSYLSGSVDSVYDSAQQTFVQATSDTSLGYNARVNPTGSGVLTDSFIMRLIYTVFAPFPWQAGSFGLQLGKIESFLFYSFMYVAYRGRRELWRRHRATVLMLGMFVIPGTIAYAATMSNVGLIVRQRMPIVVAVGILAALAYRSRRAASSNVPARARATGTAAGVQVGAVAGRERTLPVVDCEADVGGASAG